MINNLKSITLNNFLKAGPEKFVSFTRKDERYKQSILFLYQCMFGSRLEKIHLSEMDLDWGDFIDDKNFNGKDDRVITLELEFDRSLLDPPVTYQMNIILMKQDEYALSELVFYPQKKEFGAAPSISLSQILLDTKKGSEKISTFVDGKYEYYSKGDSPIKINTYESVFRQNLDPNLFAHLLPIKRNIEQLGKILK
jgi:hypothetical protein